MQNTKRPVSNKQLELEQPAPGPEDEPEEEPEEETEEEPEEEEDEPQPAPTLSLDEIGALFETKLNERFDKWKQEQDAEREKRRKARSVKSREPVKISAEEQEKVEPPLTFREQQRKKRRERRDQEQERKQQNREKLKRFLSRKTG